MVREGSQFSVQLYLASALAGQIADRLEGAEGLDQSQAAGHAAYLERLADALASAAVNIDMSVWETLVRDANPPRASQHN